MTKYIVHGGKPLFGEVEISGAKNAAVAIIPAAILVDGVCRIENIPQISDVTAILKILEQLGASIRSINRHTVEIDSRHIHTTRTSYECNIESGSGVPNKNKVATISKASVQKIAEMKMRDLNAGSLEAAMSMVAGTARSMGVVVGD